MIRSFRSTLLGLANRGYLLGGLGAALALTLLSVMINVGDAEATVDSRGPLGDSPTLDQLDSADGLAVALGGTSTLVGMVVLAVHATAMASDYSTGTIRNLLVRQPDRLRLLAGKSLGLAAVTVAASVVVVLTGSLAALMFAPAGTDTGLWFDGAGLAAAGRSAGNLGLAFLAWGLFGQALAVVSRSAVVSVTVGMVVAIPLDMTLTETVEGMEPYLPGQVLQALAQGGTADVGYSTALVAALVATVTAGAGCLTLFRRRDVVA